MEFMYTGKNRIVKDILHQRTGLKYNLYGEFKQDI
jgi:hypothetical protein